METEDSMLSKLWGVSGGERTQEVRPADLSSALSHSSSISSQLCALLILIHSERRRLYCLLFPSCFPGRGNGAAVICGVELEDGNNNGFSVFHVLMGGEWFLCQGREQLARRLGEIKRGGPLNNSQQAISAVFIQSWRTLTLDVLISAVCTELIHLLGDLIISDYSQKWSPINN